MYKFFCVQKLVNKNNKFVFLFFAFFFVLTLIDATYYNISILYLLFLCFVLVHLLVHLLIKKIRGRKSYKLVYTINASSDRSYILNHVKSNRKSKIIQ